MLNELIGEGVHTLFEAAIMVASLCIKHSYLRSVGMASYPIGT